MAVVTIAREFGSEGNYIGAQVAEALGYRFISKKEIYEVFRQYGIISFDEIYHEKLSIWSRFDDIKIETMDFLTRVVRAFAHQGKVVIAGRCSYAILKDFTDVLHVRIQAPLALKVQRVRAEQLAEPEKVEHLVQEENANRGKLLQLFYHFQWDQATAFDLVIDTGAFPLDLAVKWIVEGTRNLEARTTAEEPTTRSIAVDPILAEVISKLLGV